MITPWNLAVVAILLASPASAGGIGSTVNISTNSHSVYSDRITEVEVDGVGTWQFPDPYTAPELSEAGQALETALTELGVPMGTTATDQGTLPIGSDETFVETVMSNYNPTDNPDYVIGDPEDYFTWIAVGDEDVNVFVEQTTTYYTFHRLLAELDPACAPGSFSANGQEPCSQCLPGTSQPSSGATSCLSCPAGSYSETVGASSCTSCDPGTFSDEGATSCTRCAALPQMDCVVAAKAGLQISTKSDPAKNKLQWKLGGGSLAVEHATLGDPAASTSWTLCIYDSTLDVPFLAGSLTIGPSPSLWTSKDPKGWKYKDKAGSQGGVTGVQLKPGVAGKPKAQVKATGSSLALPPPIDLTNYFDQSPTVTVQLLKSGGPGADLCWTSEFDATDTKSNSPDKFKATAK